MLTPAVWVLAQEAQQRPNALIQMLPIVAILVIFYFLLIRPKQREQKKHQQMLTQLNKGDRVLTSGGIFGSVVGVKEDQVVIKIAENVKIELLKSAVVRRLEGDKS
jgi:preprotein translocase subunit YajC